ncbi:unnamed protein product [Musa textilis]
MTKSSTDERRVRRRGQRSARHLIQDISGGKDPTHVPKYLNDSCRRQLQIKTFISYLLRRLETIRSWNRDGPSRKGQELSALEGRILQSFCEIIQSSRKFLVQNLQIII